jgi:hypothetical protein
VEVIEVHPAYTPLIDILKYASQLSIDKDIWWWKEWGIG